jgi:hypothetical protein
VNKDDLKISAKIEAVRDNRWMFLDSEGNNDELKMSVEVKILEGLIESENLV